MEMTGPTFRQVCPAAVARHRPSAEPSGLGATGAARPTADGVPHPGVSRSAILRLPSFMSSSSRSSGRVSHPTAREPEGDGPSMGHDRFGGLRHSFGMSLLQSASSKCRWRAQAHGESRNVLIADLSLLSCSGLDSTK